MTGQHVWPTKDLSGQYPILTGHCPLTGRYLQPCCVGAAIALIGTVGDVRTRFDFKYSCLSVRTLDSLVIYQFGNVPYILTKNLFPEKNLELVKRDKKGNKPLGILLFADLSIKSPSISL